MKTVSIYNTWLTLRKKKSVTVKTKKSMLQEDDIKLLASTICAASACQRVGHPQND